MNVYIAASLIDRDMVDTIVAPALTARGCRVVSRWHSHAGATPEADAALTPEAAAEIWTANYADLMRADVVLVIGHERGGEHLCEAAIAYHVGTPLVWCGRLVLTGRLPRVVRAASVTEAIDAVADLAGDLQRRTRGVTLSGARMLGVRR